MIIRKKADTVAKEKAVEWALEHFKQTLEVKGFNVVLSEEISTEETTAYNIFVGGSASKNAVNIHQPDKPESFVIEHTKKKGQHSLAVVGADSRAIVYGLLELADIVKHAEEPLNELKGLERVKEQPSNAIRSVKRLFVNEKTDKLWFYDKSFWREYLTELASHRFNRFSLALGMGYDLGHDPNIEDFYFCFAYPFLISVPGYDVDVEGLSSEEKNKNLEMMRFIGQEADRRGLEFQVGLWTHAYEPEESPNLRYKINGLNEDNHANYCRDAIKTLLKECPEIDGLTIRVHYESGIPEPAHLFWKVVLEGISLSGRPVNLDLHPKGIDDELLQVAAGNGTPFTISPKFWAEHMGLPYHQAAIRETELPVKPTPEAGKMIITTTSRRFTRYGYADFLKEDRDYDMFFRIWPGTQRVLLWGDPEMAAGYGRAGSFCGSMGVELMEPLSFKSRKTSETNAGRDPYIDPSLRLDVQDWKKYVYSYRLWGRLLYNPDANPESWRRYLKHEFVQAAEACENALKYASRILPLITVTHSPSVANNNYWPEIYSNIFIIDKKDKPAYHCDGREPATFNEVSPLDPELFYRVNEFAEDMIENRRTGKISPLETADILERFARSSQEYLIEAQEKISDERDPAFRRLAIDVEVQIGIGQFFANKFRAGTAYAFYEKVGDTKLLEKAISHYRSAKNSWEKIAEITTSVYTDDITYGYNAFMRGHWADRLPGIEEDIERMEKQRYLAKKDIKPEEIERTKSWLDVDSSDGTSSYIHSSPEFFQRGKNVEITIELPDSQEAMVYLKFRQANQADSYRSIPMEKQGSEFTVTIPSSYTDSPYPLIYLFEVESKDSPKKLFPGFNESMCNQPYYVIRQSVQLRQR